MCKWIKRNFFKAAVLVLIVIILCFSRSIIKRAFDLNEQLFYESAKSEQSSCNRSLTDEEAITKTNTCKTVEVKKPASKTENNNHTFADGMHTKVFLYHILCIVYICVLGTVFIVLSIVLIKDTGNLRYKKLDELHDFKEKIIERIGNSELSSETVETKTKEHNNKKLVSTEVKNKKYASTEVIKHYMTSIMEV